MNNSWAFDNWRNKVGKHMPSYPDMERLLRIENELRKSPPLVMAGEALKLKKALANVAKGKGFLLQGGDCAESFGDFSEYNIKATYRIILQMAIVLTFGAAAPVVKIGRIAGQFAKPRSSPIEKKDGIELPSYCGDIINGSDFNEKSRIPDPVRMRQAYNQSAVTLNLLRSFKESGMGDLNRVQEWNLGFLENSIQGERYKKFAARIDETLSFMNACGITSESDSVSKTDFYTSHEALLLNYEEPLTRIDPISGDWYSSSAHMVWIGERTRQLDGAHVEFARGILNPVGVKIGPTMTPDELLLLCDALNPTNEEGKLTLIVRMGESKIGAVLPDLIRAVKREGVNVIWSSDPMHANTQTASNGLKTRNFDTILREVKRFFEIHKSEGTYAGGVHFEMTGQHVTECIGGYQEITEEKLGENYHTMCDPRLNASQALELAFLIAESLK
ncbi:MAG: Phospho-2-dehydro-3-deoxyheptonate aldolase [Alphaproteobacteria bacterium ADurb.Bin438]|nr:MAG: Phospho-2-dehydro-3-deoxyheptonate aldolase [Alphaproteobacteria bacterium ADurb.Bin438]